MAYDYTADQATAAEMIAEFGATYMVQTSKGVALGSVVAVAEDRVKRTADAVEAITVFLIAGNSAIEPIVGMRFTDGSDTLRVNAVTRIKPGQTTILYECEVTY